MKVGIIGLDGHTGQVTDGLGKLEGIRLAAVADPSPEKLAQFRRQSFAKDAATYGDWRAMLDRESLDIVGVCDVPGRRAPVLIELARRNIHIISEKPLATTLEDLARVREAVDTSRSQLTMLLTMRFEAPYLAVHQAVRQGAIGTVVLASSQKSYQIDANSRPAWQKVRSDVGGIVPFIGCHALDLIRWTSGQEFTQVAGFSSTAGLVGWGEFEDNAVLALRLSAGGSADVRLDFLRPKTAPSHGDDRLRLVGSEGIIEVANADPQRTQHKAVYLITEKTKPQTLPLAEPGQLLVDFVTALRNGTSARVSAEDAFCITDLCLHARHAIETGTVLDV